MRLAAWSLMGFLFWLEAPLWTAVAVALTYWVVNEYRVDTA